MRRAVITDAHGDLDGIRRALRGAAEADADQVISLGDVLECAVPTRLRSRQYGRVEDVTSFDPAIAEALAGALLIRGNQEERIAGHLAARPPTGALGRVLTARTWYRTRFAHYTHGHLLSWLNPHPDLWRPRGGEVRGRALVYGHHHRSAVFEVADSGEVRELRVVSGRPVPLDPARRHLVNVGPAFGPEPSWAVVDDAAGTVTHHFSRPRRKG